MHEEDLLTLDQAAALSGYARGTLREMVRAGRLPAVRREGRWSIARADLAWLPLAAPRGAAPKPRKSALDTEQPVPEQDGRQMRSELLALIAMIRERDAQITGLQEERVRLAGQVGMLQGQLGEREERVRLLEATLLGLQEGHAARDALARLAAARTAVTVQADLDGTQLLPVSSPAPDQARQEIVAPLAQAVTGAAPAAPHDLNGQSAGGSSASPSTVEPLPALAPVALNVAIAADDPAPEPHGGGLLGSLARLFGRRG